MDIFSFASDRESDDDATPAANQSQKKNPQDDVTDSSPLSLSDSPPHPPPPPPLTSRAKSKSKPAPKRKRSAATPTAAPASGKNARRQEAAQARSWTDDSDEDQVSSYSEAESDHDGRSSAGLSSGGSDDEVVSLSPGPAGPKRAKKGKADRSKWKRNSRATKPIADIGPCSCVNQCWKKDCFRSAKRLKLRADFVTKGRSQQQSFLASLIDVVRRKARAKAMSVRRRRARAFESVCHLPGSNGARPRVCKHMLKWVFGVQDTRLRNLCNKKISNGDVTADGRGSHGKQKTTTEGTELRIDDHLRSFPTEESHYTLKNDQKKFLNSELSVKIMYRLFLKKHEASVYKSMFEAVVLELDSDDEQPDNPAEAGASELKPVVTYQRYLDHFNKMELQFEKLASDTCSACDKAKLLISQCEGPEEKARLKQAHKAHLELADKSYEMRTQHQAKAFGKGGTSATGSDLPLPFNSESGIEYLVADFGGNVQLPKLAVGESFYLRKLRYICKL